MGDDGSVTVVLRSTLEEVRRMLAVVEDFVGVRRLPGRALFAIQVSLEEILTNIVVHGYGGEVDHDIRVTLRPDGLDAVEIVVEDDGRPFDPLDAPAPDITLAMEERPIGGLGVHLVRHLMDAVSYRRDGDRNVLTMTKHAKE
jgi:anti-sigma regulatory factor (Ser/Thr protein kinase)